MSNVDLLSVPVANAMCTKAKKAVVCKNTVAMISEMNSTFDLTDHRTIFCLAMLLFKRDHTFLPILYIFFLFFKLFTDHKGCAPHWPLLILEGNTSINQTCHFVLYFCTIM